MGPDDYMPPDEEPVYDEDVLLAPDENDDRRDLGSWEEVEWALRRIAKAQSVLAILSTRYEAQLARIDAWAAAEGGPQEHIVEFLSGRVQRWALAQRERTGTATFRFPYGVVSTRHRKDPQAAIADEAVFLAWARETLTPDEWTAVVRESYAARVSELRKITTVIGEAVVTPDGEVVPGVIVQPPETTASITITEGEPQE